MWGHKPRKVDAVGIVTEADGTTLERKIKRCCHCGSYWDVQPGSGNLRGFCFKCMDEFCGPDCCECTPLEQRLERESKQQHIATLRMQEQWLTDVYNQVKMGQRPTEKDICSMSTTCPTPMTLPPASLSVTKRDPIALATSPQTAA